MIFWLWSFLYKYYSWIIKWKAIEELTVVVSLIPMSFWWEEQGLSSAWLEPSATSSWLYLLFERCSVLFDFFVGSLWLSGLALFFTVPNPAKLSKSAPSSWGLNDLCVFNCRPVDRPKVVVDRLGTVRWFTDTPWRVELPWLLTTGGLNGSLDLSSSFALCLLPLLRLFCDCAFYSNQVGRKKMLNVWFDELRNQCWTEINTCDSVLAFLFSCAAFADSPCPFEAARCLMEGIKLHVFRTKEFCWFLMVAKLICLFCFYMISEVAVCLRRKLPLVFLIPKLHTEFFTWWILWQTWRVTSKRLCSEELMRKLNIQ